MNEKTKVNLLLVDDNEANLIAMRAILEDLNENLITVNSGKKALRRLLDDEFAVVLLDVDMPLMDGFEVAALMRKVQKLQFTPIIFITALYQNENNIAKGYALGAVDYIFKPVDPEVLKAKARFFIDLYRKNAEIKYQAALLADSNQKLDELNADLERLVNERTGQLRAAVEELQHENNERKKAEEAREELLVREQKARAEAETANRLKDEFLATLSHELRTPMNAILGWVKIINTGRADAETTVSAMESIERNAKLQAQLIEDILDVSRIISGKFQFQLDVVTLDTILKATAETLRPIILAKNIDLQIEIEGEVAPMDGDSMRLQQAIWNLLSNAVKFTPDGGRVTVSLRQDNSAMRLQVRDNGQGIEAEFLPYIFDRFRQADGSMTRKHGGLGLGLAIVHHIVEMHGGKIWAESPGVGKGACFTVEFPRHQVAFENNGAHEAGAPVFLRPAADKLQMLDGLRVLVIDDSDDTLQLTCFLLTQRHAQVEAAASVKQAFEILQDWQPHLIVSDLGMPEEDGYQFITQLRSTNQGEQIPVLALTGYALNEERERALSKGFQAFLTKPINPDEFISEVAKLTYTQTKTVP